MRLFKTKTLIVSAIAVLGITSVAYAGAATMQRDRVKDASCTTVAAAQARTRGQDGAGAQDGTGAQDRLHLHDGSCLTAAA